MDYFKEAVHSQPDERAWVTYIKAKVTEQNQSFPTLVVGQTGSGKSWSTLKLCEELEPDFQFEGNWFFRALEFYQAFNKYYKDKENAKKGKIWVLDEAGVDFSSDDWQSKTNKIFAKVFSTARFRNYIFFGTVPFTDFISKKIRKLMQYRMTANYVQKFGKKERGIIVPRCLQWSDNKEDFYYHKLVKILPNGETTDINRMLLAKPCKRLRDEYENLREAFSDSLDAELLGELESISGKDIPLDPRRVAIIQYIREGKRGQEISELMDIQRETVAQELAKLRKRGWSFIYNKEGNKIYDPEKKKWEIGLKRPEKPKKPPRFEPEFIGKGRKSGFEI